MSWLRELRSSLENPSTPLSFPAEWLLDIFNGGRTDAGIRVSELTALQVSTIYSCVDLICGAIGRLPLNVYEVLDENATRVAEEQDSHWLLHDEPNPEMTSFTFRSTLQAHALLWRNAYAEIERDGANRPIALWPRDPFGTSPRRAMTKLSWRAMNGQIITIEPGEMFYVTHTPVGDEKTTNEHLIAREDMIHLPGLSLDGRVGRSVIEMARNLIGLTLAAEKFGGKFFANGLRPSGVVELPQDMNPQAIQNFKTSLQESYGGENQHRPMVIENGMKWTMAQTTPNDAQFLETRKFTRSEIAALFHVPPHMVGETERTTRGTAEQMGIELVQYTLSPWLTSWEQEYKRKLFPQRGRSAGKFFPGFDVEDLLLPDAATRGKYFSEGKQWGWFNTDDIRKKMRLNPVGGKAGTTYWMPVNMQDSNNPMTAADGGGATGGPGAQDNQAKPDAEAARYAQAYRALFKDAFNRSLALTNGNRSLFSETFSPVLSAISEGIAMNAGPMLNATGPLSEQVGTFIGDYLDGMKKRSGEWTEESAEQELHRVVLALKVAVYRDLATQKARLEEKPPVQVIVNPAVTVTPEIRVMPGDMNLNLTLENKPGVVNKTGTLRREADGSMSYAIEERT